MVKIYHAPGTRSIRPIWLCFELELDIEIERVDFKPEFLNSPEWRAISPAGKLPILQDDGLTMFESGAMIEYLLDRYGNGRLRPMPGTLESAIYHQWTWFSESTLARPLGINRMLRAREEAGSELAADAIKKVETSLDVVERALEDRDYLLGEAFCAADIMMGYSLELTRRFKILNQDRPTTSAYLERLKMRDACSHAFDA